MTCTNYRVAMKHVLLHQTTNDFVHALGLMLAAHYVLNVSYSPQCLATLEYIQRYLIVFIRILNIKTIFFNTT